MFFRIALLTLIFSKLCAQTLVDFKVGYYTFSDKKMSKVFNEGGIDLQAAISFPVWRWLQLYGSVEYFERHGESRGLHEKATFRGVPVSFGLKAELPLYCNWSVYGVVGPRYFFTEFRTCSHFVPRRIDRSGCGGFAGAGFMYRYGCCVFDLFGEYSWKEFHYHHTRHNVYGRKINIGGGTIGGGVGYLF